MASSQTFRGFGNGLFKFGSTDDFLDYLAHPDHKSNVLLYIQQAGVGGLTVDEAGTQKITQKEPAVFIQDAWQPMPNLTIQAGLRWEAQVEPDPITPPDQVFFAGFIGKTVNGQTFPSDGTIPSDWKMWQPRLGISYDPWKDGKTVFRGNIGLFYARIPGLALASTRSTNGSIGQEIDRGVFAGNTPAPAFTQLLPAPDPAPRTIPASSSPTTTSRTPGPRRGARRSSGRSFGMGSVPEVQLRQDNPPDAVRGPQCRRLGSPWSTGLAPGGTNGVGSLTTVESTAQSKYWGWTIGVSKNFLDRVGFQANYTYSKDRSDDDNERDPFTLRYAKIHEDPSDPTSEFSKEWGYSDRDQRHRVNAYLLWIAPGEVAMNFRYAYRSAQPLDVTAAGVRDRHAAGPHQPGRHGDHPQPRAQGQPVQLLRPADLPAVRHLGRDHRALRRGVEPLQQQEHQEARGHQPRLQFRRDGPERLGRPAAIPVRRPREFLISEERGFERRPGASPAAFL